MSHSGAQTPGAVPTYDFNVNEVGPVGCHWQMVDDLADRHPFFWTTYAQGHWVFTDPKAIKEAFAAYDLFSSISEVAADPNPTYTFIPTNIDPPAHVKYRHVLNGRFSSGAVEALGPEAERICSDLVDSLAEAGSCDFMADFATRYPVTVFLHSLGLPTSDTADCARWVRDIFDNLRHPDDRPALERATGQVRAYFSGLIADRRRSPRPAATDFVSHLLASSIDDRPLADDEVLNICVVLLMAGIETTTGQLGFMFHHLATHPEDRERIVADPSLIPTAVEEFLRVHPIILPGRKATRDADFHGCPVREGDMVMLPLPAANRSDDVFPQSREVVLDRSPNRHTAFGSGPHRCLGAHLARRELAIALRVWHERIPSYRLADAEPILERGGTLSIISLPLAWG